MVLPSGQRQKRHSGRYSIEIFYQVICVLSNDASCVAVLTGIMLSRESLYKALSGERIPNFDTILKVIMALGLKLHAEAA